MAEPPTLDEIKSWPAVVSVVTAGRAIGIGRNTVYELLKQDDFPVRVLRIGANLRVVTAELVALLEAKPAR